jgi:hypothetical protein
VTSSAVQAATCRTIAIGEIIVTGPVGSPYPGTPVALGMAALSFTILIKSARSAYRRSRNATGLHEYGTDLMLLILASVLLAVTISAIWIHSTSTQSVQQ